MAKKKKRRPRKFKKPFSEIWTPDPDFCEGLTAAEWDALENKPVWADQWVEEWVNRRRLQGFQYGSDDTDWYMSRLVEMAREQIAETFDGGNIVTNNYGLKVLQTSKMLIADIDTKQKDEAAKRAAWVLNSQDLSGRIYETFAGVRVVATSQEVEMVEALPIMRAMHSDRKYVRFCELSGTYRARLEPKTNRVLQGVKNQVCRLITAVGDVNIFDGIINLHDQATGTFARSAWLA